MEFTKKVLGKVKLIPKGKVSTYKLIAVEISSPSSARAVGNALNKNKNLIKIPCHRVVCSSGAVGGYVLGTKKKIGLLRKEGVRVLKSEKIDLSEYLFKF